MYYTIYKTTCISNGKIYIGKHKTDKLNDRYLGSGIVLSKSIKKYGKDKFIKEILYIFDTEEEMNEAESKIVNEEFVKRDDTYNLSLGGSGGCYCLHDGEILHTRTDMIIVRNEDNEMIGISREEFLNGKYPSILKDHIVVKDKHDNTFLVSLFDPQYLNGNLVSLFTGKKHTKESKEKIGRANSKHQRGSGNSQYGTCWIHHLKLQQNKKIKENDLNEWLLNGWTKGRKMKW